MALATSKHKIAQRISRVVKAGLLYFFLVFLTGFLLGVIRILLIEPLIGVRWAELSEMPLMLIAIVLASRWVVQHEKLEDLADRLWVGGLALLFMLAMEVFLVLQLRDMSLQEMAASRDKVSGSVYLIMLCVFALFPAFGQRRPPCAIDPPEHLEAGE